MNSAMNSVAPKNAQVIAEVAIEALGLTAPGMPNWAAGQPVLAGEHDYLPTPIAKYKPTLLPANEARRATLLVRLAFQAAEEALANWQADNVPAKLSAHNRQASDLAAVFTSSGGDMDIMDRLCTTIANKPTLISPTYFHNSVHNAPAGYWSIATESRLPSTSISSGDMSFAAGLLEAALQLQTMADPLLLVSYDTAIKPPLYAKKPVSEPFAFAMILRPISPELLENGQSVARLKIALLNASHDSVCGATGDSLICDAGLEALRLNNPSARSLPLLAQLARLLSGKADESNAGVIIPAPGGKLMWLRVER